MSIATNETDKQVGTILESIQAVTPEVAEEAVMYYQVMNSAWLVILVVVVVVAALTCRWCWKKAKTISYDNEGPCLFGAAIAGWVGIAALGTCMAVATDLVHSFIAPQHYAAECIMELGRKAFGD